MAEKEIGFNMDKEKNFSEWYIELLKAAEIADQRYNVKGFIVHRPNAAITERIMFRIYEDELDAYGHKPAIFPSVIPEENFTLEKEHIEEFSPEVFWVTHGSDKKLDQKLALRPTSETAMYQMYSMWIRSWRDLPLKIYQSCQVWRYETKATHPLIRDREFYWLEAHNVFETQTQAEKQVLEDMEISENIIHKRFGIPFLFFKRPDWDKFAGSVYTFACDALMPDSRSIQLPSTHFLGQNFAKPFGIKFIDRNEKEAIPYQTCYGPAISRIYAALVAIHGDSRGLVMPWELASTQVVIVPIITKDSDSTILERCKKIYESLRKMGTRVVLDDSDANPGAKFYYWELRGVPVRIELGKKEMASKELTIARRDTGKREKIKETELQKYLSGVGEKILRTLSSRAEEKFKNSVHAAKNMDELKAALKKGGFVRINFCSRDAPGAACAEKIKAETHADVRGTLHGKDEKASGKCVVCGKDAGVVVYVARAY